MLLLMLPLLSQKEGRAERTASDADPTAKGVQGSAVACGHSQQQQVQPQQFNNISTSSTSSFSRGRRGGSSSGTAVSCFCCFVVVVVVVDVVVVVVVVVVNNRTVDVVAARVDASVAVVVAMGRGCRRESRNGRPAHVPVLVPS
jgi:hypothetical protein